MKARKATKKQPNSPPANGKPNSPPANGKQINPNPRILVRFVYVEDLELVRNVARHNRLSMNSWMIQALMTAARKAAAAMQQA